MKSLRLILPLFAAALAVSSLDVTAAPPASRNTGTVDVKTGATTLTLEGAFNTALSASGIKIQKIIPGKINSGKGTLSFPVSGGAFDLADIEGEITHSGGFALAKDATKVSVTDLVISTPAVSDVETLPTLSALIVINGSLQGRVNLLTLDLAAAGVSAPVTLPNNGKLVLKNVPLKLSVEGAASLNTAFGTTVFTSDTVVGTALVNAITVKGSL